MSTAPVITRIRPISPSAARDSGSRDERADAGPARDDPTHQPSVVVAVGALMLGNRLGGSSARRT